MFEIISLIANLVLSGGLIVTLVTIKSVRKKGDIEASQADMELSKSYVDEYTKNIVEPMKDKVNDLERVASGLKREMADCVRLSTKLTVVSGLTVVLLFVSCKAPTKSVETIKRSQDYLTVKIDSVIYRDSIWLEKKNDTVYLTHNTYRDRWHKDTIQRTDTITSAV